MAEGTGQGQNTDELAELIGRRGESDKRLDGEEQAAANGETARDQVGALGTLHQGDKSFDEVALGGPVVEDAEFAIARSDADSDPAAEAALAAWSEIDLAIPEFGAAAARATDADAGPAASDGAGGEPGSEQAGDDQGHADLAPSAAALAGGIDGAGQDSPAFVAQTAGRATDPGDGGGDDSGTGAAASSASSASTPPSSVVASAAAAAPASSSASAASSPAATVPAVNTAPVAVADTGSASESATLNVNAGSGVLANDTDADTSDSLSVSAYDATSTKGASVTVNADGS